jgi:DNA-binding IclR family transcriptional regulator
VWAETETATVDAPEAGLASVDLVLNMIELLGAAHRPRGVSDIARELGVSKARAHRHLRALVQRGYVRQDAETDRYAIGIKLLVLGEAVRDRFDVLGAMRPQMQILRDATGQAVTAATLVEGAVTIMEMLQGRTLIEFGFRPGARLDFHASAHGLTALAFGPSEMVESALAQPLKAWTAATITDPAEVSARVAQVRERGWATAVDQVLIGVNALAAPVFDHRGAWAGAIAIVGSTQFIPEPPTPDQIVQVTQAAAAASRGLGWKAR